MISSIGNVRRKQRIEGKGKVRKGRNGGKNKWEKKFHASYPHYRKLVSQFILAHHRIRREEKRFLGGVL